MAKGSRDDVVKKLKEILREQNREIARLKKELGRREDVSEEYKDLLKECDSMPIPTQTNKDLCPKCSSPSKSVPIGKFILIRCTVCKWRTRK